MASESDGEEELEATFSSMKQPPLIKQLRGILSEYPDGGQIIKELIQNAEDAGAKEVKIHYDGRRINREEDKKKIYRKFFQGPALCIYNDATFTEDDWEGIQMVYSSNKEGNPLKVGRFGLGFKSVFHITDHPCVISGDRVLLVDPQSKRSDRVNATMALNKLDKYKGMDVEAFLEALEGTYKIDKDVMKCGYYPGTVFWFPLRENPSLLSETLYDEKKVMELFEVFKCEANTILLFLRRLAKISLSVRNELAMTEVAKIEIVDSSEEITLKRDDFQSRIEKIPPDYNGEPVESCYTITIRAENCDTCNKDTNQGNGMKCTDMKWMVVNYFMGKNSSSQFRELIKDPNLGYSPFVGVAMPLTERQSFEGHVFCFLPLPKEGSRLTGLPVHVNGFFALSQNRHHLKLATEEQLGKTIDDKSILWNDKLITEAIPFAYEVLIKELVEYAEHLGNTTEAVSSVYDAIPNTENVTPVWQRILPALFTKLQQTEFLFYRGNELLGNNNSWIGIKEACLATFKHLPVELDHVKISVIEVLHQLDQKFVNVPVHLFDVISAQYNLTDLSPKRLCDLLHTCSSYDGIGDACKTAVLEYLLSDNDYTKMNGLKLLPLASGIWTHFQTVGSPVYVCSDEEIMLFPGQEGILLKAQSSMSELLVSHFRQMCLQGKYQMQMMSAEIAPKMIKQTLDLHFSRGTDKVITSSSTLTVQWLMQVWKFIISHRIVSLFRDIQLIPHLKHGSWTNPESEINLLCLMDPILVAQNESDHLPDMICECIEALSTKVLPSLPDWLPMSEIKDSVLIPSQSSVVRVLSRLVSSPDKCKVIETFNKKCDMTSRVALVQYLNRIDDIDVNAKEILKCLNIFIEKSSPDAAPKYVSLKENRNFISSQQYPVKYPRSLIIQTVNGSENLLCNLDAIEISHKGLIHETMKKIKQGNLYSQTEVVSFMEYFASKVHNFEEDQAIMNIAKDIPFLKTSTGMKKPSDMFDPKDTYLQDLFAAESMFPDRGQASISSLKCLGLKEVKSVNFDHLLQVAELLDSWSKSGRRDRDIYRKAKAFLHYLVEQPFVLTLQQNYNITLADRLKGLDCIIHNENRPESFPACFPWYSHQRPLCKPLEVREASMCKLVGSTMPIVSTSAAVAEVFGWHSTPPLTKVLDQLNIVKENFQIDNQTESLIIVKAIFQRLSVEINGQEHGNKTVVRNGFSQKGLIWNGEGFSQPKQIIVSTSSEDIDLRPYFHSIPEEFHAFKDLFQEIGCNVYQNVDVLLRTLSIIDKKYDSSHDQLTVTRDMELIVKILNKLAERKVELEGNDYIILIPVQSDDTDTLITMKCANDCVYDKDYEDNTPDEDEEHVFVVHEDVSVKTAETLGVRSRNKKALSDTENLGFEAWGQEEPLTARLSKLLEEGYMDGMSVPKELIQNADDAGATSVKFLYDERENEDANRRLLSLEMKECQGPALWVFNDATFSKDDLINITKLNGATKATDKRKIGKFGLGFCSVYNLTDVPSFVSGTNIIMFDPHMTYLAEALPANSPGLKIDLSRPRNRALLRKHRDQFRPFQGIFGCDDLSQKEIIPYPGTLFRFPLRTFKQSQNSQISAKTYSKKEMQGLLNMFIQAAGNLFLFTQNVQKIEVYHIPADASSVFDQSLLFTMTRECLQLQNNQLQPVIENVLNKLSLENDNTNLQEIQKRNITLNVFTKAKEVIPMLDNTQERTESSWIISWASGTKEALNISKNGDKHTLPLAAVAVPCEIYSFDPIKLTDVLSGFYKSGHIFCFLPLPLETDLRVHVNGYFDVTSDRRQLLLLTEDDKGQKSYQWNQALTEDSLVNAFMHLLLVLSMKASEPYTYHSLWPSGCVDSMVPFKRQFFRRILVDDCQVFRGEEKWVAFKDVAFLDPDVRENVDIGKIAFELLTQFPLKDGKMIVEMPAEVLTNLKENNKDRKELIDKSIVDCKKMLFIFFDNIQDLFWKNKKELRDKMTMYALQCDDEDINNLARETKCIPTDMNEMLHTPEELIHPDCGLKSMFEISDGRFPAHEFQKNELLKKLVALGMITNVLPKDILVERCYSIERIATRKCCGCASKRAVLVLKYLSKLDIQTSFKDEENSLVEIQTIYMLPVLQRPEDWQFSWKADTCEHLKRYTSSCEECQGSHPSLLLGQPNQLYRMNTADHVGSVESVVDECCYSGVDGVHSIVFKPVNVYVLLGVNGYHENKINVPTEKVVKHIALVSSEYVSPDNQFKEMYRIHQTTFTYLSKFHCEKEDDTQCIKSLTDKKIILLHKKLVLPSTVAFNVKKECSPDLCHLSDCDNLKPVYRAIGVKDSFSSMDVIKVLKKKKDKWKLDKCDEVEVINNLLQDLEDCMMEDGTEYIDYKEQHSSIVAPDINSILRPTYELVIDDTDYETSSTMNILHGRILPDVAIEFGVKPKKIKCLDELSCAIPFGQKEKLVTRLQRLLDGYPCDSSIMKELLQNADDANASEMHFIKDYRTHSTEKIFGKEELQGPALCVFNNSCFTKADIEGIHNLGIGSKGDDPTKTGQYGVGFNAVYHLTDTPSFLTKGPEVEKGETLCIFDPLCKNIPKATEVEPGIRCDVGVLKQNFPDVLLGYLEKEGLFDSGKGTLFRFPLRCKKSDISSEIITKEKMDKILSEFTEIMFEALLFVKNVNCIRISNMTDEGIIEEYSVHASMSLEDKKNRQIFFNEIHAIIKENTNDKAAILKEGKKEIGYEMVIEDSNQRLTEWYIVQIFGFENSSDEITSAFRDKMLGQSPLGGVAVPLKKVSVSTEQFREKDFRHDSRTEGKYDGSKQHDASHEITKNNSTVNGNEFCGKAFCFLPLPIKTNLPVHVHGHFVLDHEARQHLGGGEPGYKQTWNESILSNIVANCWISAIKYIQTSLVLANLQNVSCEKAMVCLMENYHGHFPLLRNGSEGMDHYWTYLVRSFYNTVVKNHHALFPVVRFSEFKKSDFDKGTLERKFEHELTWVAIGQNSLQGVFNMIKKHVPLTGSLYHNFYVHFSEKDARELESILKQIGMKLIETPSSVLDVMNNLNIEGICEASPKHVVLFLKSFKSNITGSCTIGRLNSPLEETTFKDVGSLSCIIRYMMLRKEFISDIDGLPVLLTQDGTLDRFSSSNPVFVSKFCKLLTGSASEFLNHNMLDIFDKAEMYDSKVIVKLEVSDFVSRLPNTLNQCELGAKKRILWDKKEGKPLKPEWIQEWVQFLYEKSFETPKPCSSSISWFASIPNFSHDKFQEHLHKFDEWSLLPSQETHGDQIKSELIPISSSFSLLGYSHGNEELCTVLKKFNIPTLDMNHVRANSSVIYAVKKILTTTEKPYDLLKCLLFYRGRIESTDCTCFDGCILLSFFDTNIEDLKKSNDNDLATKLRCLPLYTTHQGTLISIEHYNDVIVIPADLPCAGIGSWALATGVTLLKQDFCFERIYEFLQLSFSSSLLVYSEKILPDIANLPKEYWFEHILFIKDELLTVSAGREYSMEQQRTINLLKNIAFVNVNGRMMTVKELYCWENPVFTCMLSKDMFPPQPLQENHWRSFLEDLGLIVELSDVKLLEFAKQIENEGRNSLELSETLQKKSNVLLDTVIFPKRELENSTLLALKMVKFIIPYFVCEEMNDIFNQPNNGTKLVCFDDSILPTSQSLCWTCMEILPGKVKKLSKETQKLLGICRSPPLEKVILHCQNVCHAIKEALVQKRLKQEFDVPLQMQLFYAFFANIEETWKYPKIQEQLKHTPFVYLPDDKEFVTTSDIVIDLSTDEEVKPFLFKSPKWFARFDNLFIAMGSKKQPNWTHYAGILNKLKTANNDKMLNVNDLRVTKRCLRNMFLLLKTDKSREYTHTKLYLPNRQKSLCASKQVTVSDNEQFEGRLNGRVDINFFIGFQNLEIDIRDPSIAFKMLPCSLQPVLLSHVVKEEICEANMNIKKDSRKAAAIEEFIHSNEFLQGILRLVKHQLSQTPTLLNDNDHVKPITSNLQSVKVAEVTGLKTVLNYEGRNVNGSERAKTCFIKSERTVSQTTTFYFQDKPSLESHSEGKMNISGLISIKDGLVNLVDGCSKNILQKETIIHLPSILALIDKPENIKAVLTDDEIDMYDLPQSFIKSVFPEPGTYLEEQFHPFLEQGISPFQRHEYKCVVLELEDACMDMDSEDMREPIYRYVHIIDKIKSEQIESSCVSIKYVINDGSGIEITVPIYRLYRFVRRETETGSDVVVYDDEPVGTVGFDENCRRIREMLVDVWKRAVIERRRVIRRLLMKWHPDKNFGNEKYSTRVFNYIKEVVIKLEREHVVEEAVNSETGRTAPDTSGSSYYGMSCNINKRADQYRRAYYDNVEDYNRTFYTGRYAHTTASKVVRHDNGEAKRWLRQAQNDYKAAEVTIPLVKDVNGYNWVCYTCHQACEKALKAAWFTKDANTVPLRSHSLTYIAAGLSTDTLTQQIILLERRLGEHTRMRYPDNVSRPDIPSDLFDNGDAEFSLQVARSVIELADEIIQTGC